MRAPRLLFLLLAVACAQSNQKELDQLTRDSAARRDPVADRLIRDESDEVEIKGRPVPITLPFVADRLPTVRGRVNGVEMPLILDTGASICSLSGGAARAAGLYLPAGRESRTISPGYDARFRVGAFSSLRLGPQEFGHGVVLVPLRDRVGGRYGIVGCSILGQYRVTFDFKRREARLVPTGRTGKPLFVRVHINGRPCTMLVDSGATRTFLEPRVGLELGLITERDMERHRSKTDTFRSGKVTQVRLKTVKVAGKTFEDVSAGVVLTFGDRHKADGLLGLVGFGKLSWTLDFSARTIRLND